MKKTDIKLLLIALVPLFLLNGCKDDDETGKVPAKFSVVFAMGEDQLSGINLDETIGPEIWGSIRAPEGLRQVAFAAVNESGEEVVREVTSFEDPSFYEFKVRPVYSDGMTGFKVTATDAAGKTAENIIPVSASGGKSGPAIALPADTVRANIGIGLEPAIEGSIGTHWGIASVSYYLLRGEEQEAFGDPVTSFEDSILYNVSIQPEYTLDLTGLRVVAVDSRGVESDDTVMISVIDAGHAPAVTFDQESIEADMKASPPVAPPVSGTIVSDEGLVSVSYYLAYAGGEDEQFGESVTSFPDPNEYAFTVDPPYGFGVIGVKVVATDALGQETAETVTAAVNAEDTELVTYSNVVLHAQANREDAGVNTAFSTRDGSPYTLMDGTDQEVSETIDFITVDSGGNDELDLFSPSHTGWLEGNYFDGTEWPVRNETRMRQLEVEDGEAYFNAQTSADIRALSLQDDWEDRVDPLFAGDVVFFVTSEGKKGLLYFKSHDPNADDGSKADLFTFDIKVVQ